MTKYKRSNYLIDKPFQIGFIVKFLIVIIITVLIVFAGVIAYYYMTSIYGEGFLNQNVVIASRTNMTKNGNKLYQYDVEKIIIYEVIENGSKIYKCYDPKSNEKGFKKDDIVPNVQESALGDYYEASTKTTKIFYIILFPLLAISIGLIIVISIYSLFFSHKMAGPVYRLRVSLDRMLAGDFDFKIKVRKGDFFTNIVDKLEFLRLKVKNNDITQSSPKDKLVELKNLVQNKATNEEIVKKIDDIIG